ncbi:trypsin-like serine peptidase [Tahibacter soli]|uniref:Serine protease n=1 Tax=Tahibacter soli TaxID=2983605 RepID=A0A9X3YL33_9GAMM|nr:serine protease [Tahibacter soli]MDC8013577.1 serine protease [Tahibacter soli]
MSADARRCWQTATRACAIPIPRDQVHARGGECLVAAWRPRADAAPRILLSAPSTAFLVSPRHVMTAAHALPPQGDPDVVYAFGYAADTFRAAERGLPAYFELRAASVFRVRAVERRVLGVREGDCALIELERDVPADVAVPLTFASREPQLGEPIALAGCADGQPVAMRDGSVLGFDAIWLDHDVEAGPGWSGAPVLDAQGGVLATHTGTAVGAALAASAVAGGVRRMRGSRVV